MSRLNQYLIEGIKVWLDDERKAPPGYIHIKTTPELIKYYEKNHDKIDRMSLDHDLGDNIPTGYDFMLWLEEMVHTGKYNKIPDINVHSANPVGRKRMLQALASIQKRLK